MSFNYRFDPITDWDEEEELSVCDVCDVCEYDCSQSGLCVALEAIYND